MIKFENVNVTMQGKRILSDINLEIQDGEFVLICGESGCGKLSFFIRILLLRWHLACKTEAWNRNIYEKELRIQ